MKTEKEVVIKQIAALHKTLRQDMSGTKWVLPAPGDCIRYAAMEAAEVLDAEMRQRRDHARNNERMQADTAVGVELADVIIMAHSAILAMENKYGGDYYDVMIKKATDDDAVVVESTDGIISDSIVIQAMICLEDYTMLVSEEGGTLAMHLLASSLGRLIGKCYSVMIKFGFDPLVFVKNKCVGFAVKHGGGSGISYADKLEQLCDTFVALNEKRL